MPTIQFLCDCLTFFLFLWCLKQYDDDEDQSEALDLDDNWCRSFFLFNCVHNLRLVECDPSRFITADRSCRLLDLEYDLGSSLCDYRGLIEPTRPQLFTHDLDKYCIANAYIELPMPTSRIPNRHTVEFRTHCTHKHFPLLGNTLVNLTV